MPDVTIDLTFLSAVALAGVAYLLGEFLVRYVPALPRNYIPEPVIGGIVVAFGILLLRLVGVEISIPTSGRPMDFLIGLLTTQMGLHVTPAVLRKGVKLFPLFFSMGVVLYFVQLVLVSPVAFFDDTYLESATLWGPISFVGAPYNLNPPAQFGAITEYFQPAYPNVSELGKGLAMIGVLAAVVLPGQLGRRLMERVDQKPPKPSPSQQHITEPVWSIATDQAALAVLVLTTIALAFSFQDWLLDTLGWMKQGYLPIIVICYLAGALFRLGYELIMGKRIEFPQLSLNALLMGPTMAVVLTYAVMSAPLYDLRLVTLPMILAAILAITGSVAVARLAFPLFERAANHYAAGAAAVVFLGITTAWGPFAMSYLRRFMDEEGQPELVPAVLPLHAFYIFPWTAALLTMLLFEIFG